jgi:hypothetical protein
VSEKIAAPRHGGKMVVGDMISVDGECCLYILFIWCRTLA